METRTKNEAPRTEEGTGRSQMEGAEQRRENKDNNTNNNYLYLKNLKEV